MANPTWKRIERTQAFKTAKLFAKRLIGKELRLKPEIALATAEHTDWTFHPAALHRGAIVYSLGVGEDVAFDTALITHYGAHVHAFDPTPNTVAWIATQTLPDDFRFHAWAVTATDGHLTLYPRVRKDGSVCEDMFTMMPAAGQIDGAVEVPAFCLKSIQKRLGHAHIDLLKMDIEGAEYEVLGSMLDAGIRPTQLLVEFHHRYAPTGTAATRTIMGRLHAHGYQIFGVSINGREVSFYRKPTP